MRGSRVHRMTLLGFKSGWNGKESRAAALWPLRSGMDWTQVRHVIWDWNGTLLDDAWLCREIMNGQLRKRGLPTLRAERYEAIFDFPVEGYYRKVGFDWKKESFEEAGTEFIVEYENTNRTFKITVLNCYIFD